MSKPSSAAGLAGSGASFLRRSWPPLALTLTVVLAAVYSFSPRPNPPFPATEVRSNQLQVNALAASGTRLVAVGEQGHILLADSPRGPWRQAKVEPQRGSTLTQVFFDREIALAIGHDGWILRSTDRGDTWKEIAFNTELSDPLLGIAGPFDGKLYAFGAFGLLMSSSDRGLSWQRQTLTINNPNARPAPAPDPADVFATSTVKDYASSHINAMTRTADGALLMVGERGLLATSTDAGQSWTLQPEIYAGSFFGVLTLPSNGLLVYGMRGNAFVSNDNGRTWQKSKVPETVSLFGGTVTASGDIILVGASNGVFASKDGGSSFTRIARNERRDLADVLVLEGGTRLTAGDGGIRLYDPKTAQGEK